MILYLDTSALVKLYALEPGSEAVRQAIRVADLIATSLVAYAEARSALARKARAGEIDEHDLKKYKQQFERDWLKIHQLPVDEALVHRAGALCEEYALRAFDAIHLAAADILQATLRATVTFACFDSALNRAAELRGLACLARA